jgi:hypothetical protein
MYVRTGRSLETEELMLWNITKNDRLIMTTNNRRFPGMGKPTRYFTLFPHNGRDWPGKGSDSMGVY